MKKVAFLVTGPENSISGVESAVGVLSNGLNENYCQLVVYRLSCSEKNQKARKDWTDIQPGNVVFLYKNVFNLFLSVAGMCREVVRFKPDVIHSHGLWGLNNIVYLILMSFYRSCYLISPHGMLDPYCILQKRIKKTIAFWVYQKIALNLSDSIVCNSKKEVENVRRLVPNGRLSCLYNPVELNRISTILAHHEKKNQSSKTLLFLSRYHPIKGIEKLLTAWSQLRPSGWRLLMHGVGDDSYFQFLQKVIRELGLVDLVSLNGPLYGDLKYHAIKDSDVVVLPSYSENFGLVVAEALAIGVPVITTTGTPWGEIAEKKCGWICDLNSGSLLESLKAATSCDKETLTEIGMRGRDYIARFDIKNVVSDYQNIVEKELISRSLLSPGGRVGA